MTDLFPYLLEVTLGSCVLFLGYFLFSGKLSIPFRRFYLLSCIVVPLLLPLVTLQSAQSNLTVLPQKLNKALMTETPNGVTEKWNAEVATTPDATASVTPTRDPLDWRVVATFAYCSFAFVLLIRVGASMLAVAQLIQKGYKNEAGDPYYLVKEPGLTGGSFFGWIFIHEQLVHNASMEIILAHEQCHVKSGHSMDILLSEIYCALLWINPMAWIIRKEIKLNIEHEADRKVAGDFGRKNYANMLLDLSANRPSPGPMLSFSAFNIQRRIEHILNERKHHWAFSSTSIPFLMLAFWLISCETEMMEFSTMDTQAALANVKTVTTRYISHQEDTQQKDGRVIAVAYYLPDGTVDRVVQHMSYPYDFENPFERTFLTTPNPTGVLHIMDGFDVGEGRNNILYGHDWPKYHTIDWRSAKNELYKNTTTIHKNEKGLPSKFTLTEEYTAEDRFDGATKRSPKGSLINTFTEEFEYEGSKVVSLTTRSERPESEITHKNQTIKIGGSRLLSKIGYTYDGDNLVEVSNKKRGYGSQSTTKMEYEHGIMKSSSFYRNDTKYHYREFFYDSDGLKTRTEIYNVHGEPEYTIIYDYEYY